MKLKRVEIGRYLGLEGDALFDRLVDWASEFGFKLDDEFVTFEGGRREDFIAALEKDFADWGKKAEGKDGKV